MKSLIGKDVIVFFYDHADGEGLVLSKTLGNVRDADGKRLILCRWIVLDENDETTKQNEEYYTLAITTIKEIRIIVRTSPYKIRTKKSRQKSKKKKRSRK